MRDWVVPVALALLGLAFGLVLARWLGTRAYRYDDERDLPLRPVWWVAPMLAVALGLVGWRLADASWAVLLTYAAATTMFVLLTAIDADVHRLPDKVTLPAYPVFIVLLAVCSLVGDDWGAFVRALATGAALFVVYLLLAMFSPGGGGLGFGDVKLAGTVGMLTGWIAWPLALTATFLAFLVGAVIAVVLIIGKRAGLKTQIAFGPSMMAGALLAILLPSSALTTVLG